MKIEDGWCKILFKISRGGVHLEIHGAFGCHLFETQEKNTHCCKINRIWHIRKMKTYQTLFSQLLSESLGRFENFIQTSVLQDCTVTKVQGMISKFKENTFRNSSDFYCLVFLHQMDMMMIVLMFKFVYFMCKISQIAPDSMLVFSLEYI